MTYDLYFDHSIMPMNRLLLLKLCFGDILQALQANELCLHTAKSSLSHCMVYTYKLCITLLVSAENTTEDGNIPGIT